MPPAVRRHLVKSTLIYIVGGGHSGSTLLSMIIGCAPEVFCAGEPYFYNNYEDPEIEPKIKPLVSEKCSCGEKYRECTVWSEFRESLPRPIRIARVPSLLETAKVVWNMVGGRAGWAFGLPTADDKTFFETLEGVLSRRGVDFHYILDSSKDPRRLLRLYQAFGRERIKVIHLCRDGRAYANSYGSSAKARVRLEGQEQQNVYINGLKWVIFNGLTRRFLQREQIDHINISYDLFCRDPDRYVTELNARFGLHIPANYRSAIANQTFHGIHGNLIRFDRIGAIRYDDSWREQLTPTQRRILGILLAPMNRALAFRDDVTGTSDLS